MGKTLHADIVVGGKADSSFYQLGTEIQELGSYINTISQKLITFGKESVEAYTSYEDAMLSTRNALSTQYTSTVQLNDVMEQLDDAALEWANNSTFDTDDVAEAISEAAHSGWDLNQIMAGVPTAMELSRAGGLDLADGLQYLVDISNAAQVSFEDLGDLADYWAYAADSSSTTIPEMGAALQRMGATMQFAKGDMAGLVTMLAVLADNGTKGEEAGTLLRNSMLRLIAPTKTAAEAIDSLNLTEEELEEIYSDSSGLEEATTKLDEAGFSAYDAEGNLKNFLTIWKDLDKAVSGMSEEDKYDVLSSIFPTRTITGALALLEAAGSDYNGLYESILDNAEGYTERASETMESGLGGAIRHLESVYNVLQTRTGSTLADDVSAAAGAVSSMIESINGMDDAAFSGIVGAMEVLAAAGPGLMTVGAGLKIISMISSAGPVAWIATAAVGAGMLVKGLNDYLDVVSDERFSEQFGTNSFDESMLGSYISSMTADAQAATEQLNAYNEAVQASIDQYQASAESLTSGMATAAITGKHLTEEEKQQFYTYGDEMYQALLAGIDGRYASAMQSAMNLAGDISTEDANFPVWDSIMESLENGAASAITTAEGLSQQLRSALTSAFADGTITDEERANFLEIMNQYNELAAKMQTAQSAAEYQVAMERAQDMGWEGTDTALEQFQSAHETQVNAVWDDYENMRYGLELSGGGTPEQIALAQNERDAAIAAADAVYAQSVTNLFQNTDLDTGVNAALLDAVDAAYSGRSWDSDYWEYNYADRERLHAEYGKGIEALGGEEEMLAMAQRAMADGNTELAYSLRELWTAYEISGQAADYQWGFAKGDNIDKIVDSSDDAYYKNLLYGALSESMFNGTSDPAASFFQEATDGQLAELKRIGDLAENSYELSEVQIPSYMEAWADSFGTRELANGGTFDGADLRNAIAAWMLAYGKEIGSDVDSYDYRKYEFPDTGGVLNEWANLDSIPVSTTADEENAEETASDLGDTILEGIGTISVETQVDQEAAAQTRTDMTMLCNAMAGQVVDISPYVAGTGVESLADQGVQMSVDGDTTKLAAKINAEDGHTLTQYLDGDAENLHFTIMSEDGQVLTEYVNGNTSDLERNINRYNGKVITVYVDYQSGNAPGGGTVSGGGKAYALGGRATEASIFGEAGAEWAIPEEHSQRTAELLQSAATASGFTWPELLNRTGGLNTGNSLAGYTLYYNPTIIANDASGVESKLMEDKKRLEKWMQDRLLRDEVEVYQ